MANTLTFRSPTSPMLDLLVPPPSREFGMQSSMPHVFVTPPEEELEYNPPFCYFDAAEAARHSLCTSPDIHTLDVKLGLCQQTDNRAPAFSRTFSNVSQDTVVMPRRASLVKLQDMDVDPEALEAEDGLPDIRSRRSGRTERTFDEEIVEVVKVRRNEGVGEAGEGRGPVGVKLKKSATFRARASQALRSIKLNVGGGSAGGKAARQATVSEQRGRISPAPPLQTSTLPVRSSFQGTATSPKSPTMSRRRSLTLGQLFTSFKENQVSRPETPSAEEPLSPTSPTLVPSESGSTSETIASHARSLQPSPTFDDEEYDQTPSRPSTLGPRSLNVDGPPKPTLTKRKSFRRRLSVLELQKLFTLGSSTPSNEVCLMPLDCR